MATTNSENDRRIDYVEFNVSDVTRADGRLTGGFARGEPSGPGGPLVILYANDLAEAQARIEAAGGRIVKPAYDFPGGSRFHFADPDGYQLAVWTARG